MRRVRLGVGVAIGIIVVMLTYSQRSLAPVKTMAFTATPRSTSTASPTATDIQLPLPTPLAPPTRTPAPWVALAPGVEEQWFFTKSGPVFAIRLDLAQITIRVHYTPQEPHSIADWQEETGAWVVINGGFFDADRHVAGRLISDGVSYGDMLDHRRRAGVGGMFAISEGRAYLFALGHSSYWPSSLQPEQAVEGYPLLVLPGGIPTYFGETHRRARRTVVATDREERVLFIISHEPRFTLFELSHWLAEAPLNLDAALNLDGGRSTGMQVVIGDRYETFLSETPLPSAIAVYPRPEEE